MKKTKEEIAVKAIEDMWDFLFSNDEDDDAWDDDTLPTIADMVQQASTAMAEVTG